MKSMKLDDTITYMVSIIFSNFRAFFVNIHVSQNDMLIALYNLCTRKKQYISLMHIMYIDVFNKILLHTLTVVHMRYEESNPRGS